MHTPSRVRTLLAVGAAADCARALQLHPYLTLRSKPLPASNMNMYHLCVREADRNTGPSIMPYRQSQQPHHQRRTPAAKAPETASVAQRPNSNAPSRSANRSMFKHAYRRSHRRARHRVYRSAAHTAGIEVAASGGRTGSAVEARRTP